MIKKKTLDLLDAGLTTAHASYAGAPPHIRERTFSEKFWLDETNWQKYYAKLSAINFGWKEFKYTDITFTNQLENVISTRETGIYMFYVRPDNLIFDMPKFVLYIGIAGATNSNRPLRERLKDYFNISSISKRDAVFRLLEKYSKRVYIAYSLLAKTPNELSDIEKDLIGFFYPIANKDDFPTELRPTKKSF